MQQMTQTNLNGVNVQKLFETIQSIKADSSLAQCHFRASDQWIGGGHNQFKIEPCYIAHAETSRPATWVFDADEPPVLLSNDEGPNPVEYTLGSLLGCMTTTMAYHAASRGIPIDKIESKVEGDIDLRGLMQIDPSINPGYEEIRVKFRVKSNGDPDLLKKLTTFSPVYNTITRPVRVVVDVETYQ